MTAWEQLGATKGGNGKQMWNLKKDLEVEKKKDTFIDTVRITFEIVSK